MSSGKTQTQLLEEISDKLDQVVGLMAVRGLDGDTGAMIEKLHEIGLKNDVIAPIVGLKENAVRVRIQRSKKKRKTRTK